MLSIVRYVHVDFLPDYELVSAKSAAGGEIYRAVRRAAEPRRDAGEECDHNVARER